MQDGERSEAQCARFLGLRLQDDGRTLVGEQLAALFKIMRIGGCGRCKSERDSEDKCVEEALHKTLGEK
jgi:hypothetical protein